MTEAAIDAGIVGDRYVSLGEPVTANGTLARGRVRIYVKPFVDWIWGGCFLMALGGFLAMSDRRYRLAVRAQVRRWRVARSARNDQSSMKSLRLLVPLAIFVVLVGVPVGRARRAIRAKCPRR